MSWVDSPASRIIGLVGRARSGKDTVCDVLIETMGGVHRRVRYSRAVKASVCELFGLTFEEVDGAAKDVPSEACNGWTPREAIVWLTDATMVHMGTDFFSRRVFRDFDAGKLGTHIIIPDVRYGGDVQEIRNRGGTVIKVERVGASDHAYEMHIDAIQGDITICNTGNISEFLLSIQSVLDSKLSESDDR